MADKSQDFQWASWRPRRASGIDLTQVQRPEIQEPSFWRLAGSKPKKSQCFTSGLEKRWNQCPSSGQQTGGSAFSLLGGSALLFYSDLPLIGWGPPPFQRATWFIQSNDFSVNPIQKHPHSCSETNSWPHVLAPCGQSSWHRKLTNTLATNRRSIQWKPNTIIKPSYNL